MRAGGGQLDPATMREWRRYVYRKVVPMTVAQYDEEPVDAVEWTVRIYELEEKAKAKDTPK